MTFTQIWLNSYFNPRRALEALAQLKTLLYGALYALIRGLLLSLFFYLPFYLLKFEPITPAYLKIFDTPNYFLYAAFFWPLFGLITWVYLDGEVYVLLRVLGYPANFDIHTNATFQGIAHLVIADPWSIALTAFFFRKYFGVPIWLSVLLGIIVRILYLPMAIVFSRS